MSQIDWSKYDSAILEVNEKFKQYAGFIKADDDHWDGSTVVVFYDYKKFDPAILPKDHNGFLIVAFDVYRQRDEFEKLLQIIKENHGEKLIEGNHFNKTLDIYNNVIKDYESR